MAHNNLGLLLFQRGGVNEAMYYLERATTLSPHSAEAHNNFGNALRVQNRLQEAIDQFQIAAELRPNFAIYHANLGSALAQSGRVNAAIAHYRTAIKATPSDPFIANNLAWLLATSRSASDRDGLKAVELAERAVHLSANNARLLGTLAAAYAEAGRFDEAIAAGEKARQLAVAEGNLQLARFNDELLELFRARRPFHGK